MTIYYVMVEPINKEYLSDHPAAFEKAFMTREEAEEYIKQKGEDPDRFFEAVIKPVEAEVF